MTNKEKERFFTQTIKRLSKTKNWKFKGYFIFKNISNLFFESNFFIDPKKDNVHGYLAYKPYSVDNTFWAMTEMPENSNMPLSFRAEAAFRVSSLIIYKYDVQIKNTERPEKEIKALLNTIDEKVEQIVAKNITVKDFLDTLQKENNNPVGIITCFIELGEYEKVLQKIDVYRKTNIHSGYSFEGRDFFDLIERVCNRELGIKDSVLMKIRNRINKKFKN